MDRIAVGCGIAGLASALALVRAGHRVRLSSRFAAVRDAAAPVARRPALRRYMASVQAGLRTWPFGRLESGCWAPADAVDVRAAPAGI